MTAMLAFRSSSRSRSHRRDSSSSVDQADPVVNPDDVNVEWSGDGVCTIYCLNSPKSLGHTMRLIPVTLQCSGDHEGFEIS